MKSRQISPVLCLFLLTGCSLSFDFDNAAEKLPAESITMSGKPM